MFSERALTWLSGDLELLHVWMRRTSRLILALSSFSLTVSSGGLFSGSRMASTRIGAISAVDGSAASQKMQLLAEIQLQPLRDGHRASNLPNITASILWSEKPALIYVVRRPG